RQHYELASGRFEMGLAPITDLHDARARLASREARTLEAEIALGDALQALRELTGDIPEALQPLADGFEPIDPEPDAVEPWVEAALEQNLTVQSQRELVELARRTVKIQKAGHYPTLDLVGRFNNQTTDGTLFGGGSEVETTDITLQFSLPLYHGGATSSKSREANEQYNKARSDYEKALRETERLARSSFLGVKNSIARIAALKQALVAQQSTLEAKQEGYRSGLFTSLAVLDAERDLYMAMAEFAQSRYDYILNSLKLRQADGSLSETDLELASSWFTAMPTNSGMTDEMKDEGTPN
ncbi:MAG: type I secretion protein TolC, partial [Desulfuromonas sp.]